MATTPKSCGCKKSSAVASSKSKDCSFPKNELKAWLKGRNCWSHDDWLSLLEDLRKKGFSKWTDCEHGRTEMGQFLETEKSKV